MPTTKDNTKRQMLVASIDRHIAKRWDEEEVSPAPPADDAEFMRRVYLDVSGKIPSVAAARLFLADTSPDKRTELVNRLLEGPGYVTHFTNMWRSVMMPEAGVNFNVRYMTPGFEAWLRVKLADNVAYDKLVYELLTTPLNSPYAANPVAFYQAKEIKPENLAAATSRMFLGIRIECAQCHDHPFDEWKRDQFWKFATFFAGMQRRQRQNGVLGSVQEFFTRRTLTIPDTDQVVNAAYLDDTRPKIRFGQSARVKLAQWMTGDKNPYFARTAVNRLWAHFFGVGIVDPVDDFTSSNAASHPELLGELASEFAKGGFDLKFLMRAITSTRAYQLTSSQTHESQANPRLFARMAVKGLAPEQLFDSVAQAVGYQHRFNAREQADFYRSSPKMDFIQRFTNDDNSPTERQTTILQALAMMNGEFIAGATSLDKSATLASIAEFPLFSTKDRIESLFLATLSRKPRPEELNRFVRYVKSGGARKDQKRALADVFWVLLNGSEFMFNH